MSMSNPADRVEIITSVQRRRRLTAAEKVRIVEETFEPGMTVSLVARRHGVAPNQLFQGRARPLPPAGLLAGSSPRVAHSTTHRKIAGGVSCHSPTPRGLRCLRRDE